ncbi:MAG: hypothetical protein R3C26_07450 [Calditrichia bacterium]
MPAPLNHRQPTQNELSDPFDNRRYSIQRISGNQGSPKNTIDLSLSIVAHQLSSAISQPALPKLCAAVGTALKETQCSMTIRRRSVDRHTRQNCGPGVKG